MPKNVNYPNGGKKPASIPNPPTGNSNTPRFPQQTKPAGPPMPEHRGGISQPNGGNPR